MGATKQGQTEAFVRCRRFGSDNYDEPDPAGASRGGDSLELQHIPA